MPITMPHALPQRSRHIALPAVLLASAALLSGCTTRLSGALDEGGPPLPGIPYRLPTKALVVDATWVLDSCAIQNDANNIPQLRLGYTTTATITEQRGEGERLVLDYEKMATTFKTSKIDVSYWEVGEGKAARQTALLKSINAEIKGEEPAALEAALKAAGTIASLALGVPVLPAPGAVGAAANPVPTLICNPALFAPAPDGKAPGTPAKPQPNAGHITRLKQTPARLKAIAQEVADATLQLSAIKTRTLGVLSDRDKKIFDELNANVEKLTGEQNALTKDAALISAAFGIKASVTEALSPDVVTGTWPIQLSRLPPDAARLRALALKTAVCNPEAKLSKDQCDGALSGLSRDYGKVEQAMADEVAVVLSMQAAPGTLTTGSGNNRDALKLAAVKGVVYREPAAYRFSIVLPELADQDPHKPARRAAETLADATIMVPQLGRISYLPLQSGWGEKVELKAEFTPDGMPIRSSHGKTESGGVALAKGLKQAVDQVAGLVSASKEKADAKAKDAAGSELANLNARIELLTAQSKIATLEKAATPDPTTAARDAELAILRFEKEKAELRQAIAKASAQ